jgi:redox-sensing transcriptional repressor
MTRTKRTEKQAPREVGRETVERLSRYRSVLLKLQGMGFSKVFSGNLGDALGLSGSQVRKDFAVFGMRGVKRGGYDIVGLLTQMAALLGTSEQCRAVVIGCGKIGQALLRSFGGRRGGVSIVAGFDSDPQVVSPVPDVPVLDVGELPAYIKKNGIEVAILCTPEQSVSNLLEQLRSTGVIRGVLNFTPTPLRSDEQFCVQNIDIRMELEKLFCLIHFDKHRRGEGKGS